MRKGRKRGGGVITELNWRDGSKYVFGVLVILLSIIIPILANMNYNHIVSVLIITYGVCLILFSFMWGTTPEDDSDSTGASIVGALILFGILLIISGLAYKHYVIFLPISFGVIGAIISAIIGTNFVENLDYRQYLTTSIIFFTILAVIPIIILIFNQFFLNTV
jgi:hypothetical protein